MKIENRGRAYVWILMLSFNLVIQSHLTVNKESACTSQKQ